MVQKFLNYQAQQGLNLAEKSSLIAVSGGIDSVVLCHLFHQAGYPFAMAHCNFQLRGKASEEDAVFVKKLAAQFNVSLYSTTFETKKITQQKKQSIQMVARDLRYEWLHQLRIQHHFDDVVTAHHLNDAIETVLYNFTKGCGIRGLHGILPQQEHLIRPLLFATKKEIETFAFEHHITFREDASNASDTYQRNKIRHQVVPVLEQINENFTHTAQRTLQRLQEAEQLYDFAIATLKKKVFQIKEDQIQIDVNLLKKQPASTTILYELLKPYQFNANQVTQILNDTHHQAGSQFFTTTHQAVLHHHFLYIESLEKKSFEVLQIKKTDQMLQIGHQKLTLKIGQQAPSIFSKNPNIAYLDANLLHFPLSLRHWRAGDFFQPIGMQGKHQKIQDFFSNQKLSRLEKEKVWLLESNGQICWVLGFRMDERFKITAQTTEILTLKIV